MKDKTIPDISRLTNLAPEVRPNPVEDHQTSGAIPYREPFAEYYDLLYRDKDYEQECDLIEEIANCYATFEVQTVLDAGCGTGGHSIILAGREYQVSGVDRSNAMLRIARMKSEKLGKNIEWFNVDIRKLDLQRTFDICLALFAVISFQISNSDVEAALRAVRRHLPVDGLFIFDVWYGPAVLRNGPEKRLKKVETETLRLLRYATPHIDTYAHINETRHHVFVLDRISQKVIAEFQENQKVRYFFPQEIAFYLKQTGFEVIEMFPFPELGASISEEDWNLGIVARAIPGRS